MSDPGGQDKSGRIELNRGTGSRLEMKKGVDQGTVRQSFSHGRSKAVAVEVKKRRIGGKPAATGTPAAAAGGVAPAADTRSPTQLRNSGRGDKRGGTVLKPLTDEEKKVRLRALSESRKVQEEARKRSEENAKLASDEADRRRAEDEAAALRKAEEDQRRQAEEESRRKAEEQAARLLAEEAAKREAAEAKAAPETRSARAEPREDTTTAAAAPAGKRADARPAATTDGRGKSRGARRPGEDDADGRAGRGRGKPGARSGNKRGGRLELGDDEDGRRGPSMAKLRRMREKARQQTTSNEPIIREVIIPETITVQDLAQRMAIRGAEVVKVLMKSGVMATINQTIDADTAEIVVEEFGHTAKRVSEADVEVAIEDKVDLDEDMIDRAPVVTVMGHVDHGKTSLLDALRKADVAAGEAGGITQHIGAYQVDIGTGRPVSFIDTPGHAAFTSMRARGASVTDIVVLVVAADDGVMPQTIEAINHAKAAKVPIIVAINKIDKPDGDASRVKQELLSHEVVCEEFGGDVQAIEVSATKKLGLDKLIEAILLQSEVLELKANPNREAHGAIIEARLDRGRGVVGTSLIQRGTLKVGDIVVAGAHWGRVRALINDRGEQVTQAGPSMPVEILGLDGVPEAGEVLSVVENERQAREIADYRQRKQREQAQVASAGAKVSLEDMFSQIKQGEVTELPVLVKSDVHGSLEAIINGLEKIETDEARVRVLHGAVGGITESDITLAQASGAIMIGFNVRANAQARELARRDGVEIRYYSVIYELLDEVKAALSGMLSPDQKEVILGHAQIREVFSVSKIGKIAGCRVVDGIIKRQAKCRLLRDDVVIFEGALGSLKRFKDDVREVRDGFECGMSIENYNDIREGDLIEAFEVEEVARTL